MKARFLSRISPHVSTQVSTRVLPRILHRTTIAVALVAALVGVRVAAFADPVSKVYDFTTTKGWTSPAGSVVRYFDPPPKNWLPGHRGIDLAVDADGLVVAPFGGQIAFAGLVYGKPVITISHSGPFGDLVSSFEPVTNVRSLGEASDPAISGLAEAGLPGLAPVGSGISGLVISGSGLAESGLWVSKGDNVVQGQVIGELAAWPAGTNPHCDIACVHWGVRRGEAYLDPLTFIGAPPIVLLPLND
ncbi:MAG: M23 family metallopeptidase [Cellulomonadaceae bacterium]|jgi:murein DD-endopeptidase MepM/ murein hydrolase activator NlpD|nr:M23 family metallopeptidase [Cellulomonadaceae bacterium]